MLWFDNDPKADLSAKIARAASYYRNKYGKTPTLCFVHHSMLPASAANSETPANGKDTPAKNLVAAGLEVRSNRSVLPNHFWLGVNGVSSHPIEP